MRVTNDVSPVGRQECVLAVLETSTLMWTSIDIRDSGTSPAQHEDWLAAGLVGIERPRSPGLQLIESTQAHRRHRVF